MFWVWFWKNLSKISFFQISRKNLEKFHFLISISNHFDFAFPSRKRIKANKFTLQIPKKIESKNFSVFTFQIKMKTLLEIFNPILAGTCIQGTGNIFEQIVGRWRDCVLVCLEFVIVWCARYISLILAGAELCTQMFNYLTTFHTLCRRFFLLFQIPGELDFFKMRQYFIFQGKTCV